ncbi:MAG: hypothetical protein L6Q99_02540 [Planctomycetes bacterium]|nr:hypothetical protein [Planctomycetota bacterium]
MEKPARELKPPYVVTEAFYELCHDDDRANIYFKLPLEEQVRVMSNLLTEVEKRIGGDNAKLGAKLLADWATPKEVKGLPQVNGHDHLTEEFADEFLDGRAAEVQALYAQTAVVRTSVKKPCPNCIPFGELHLSVRGTYLLIDGEYATVRSPTSLRRDIVARIGVRMRLTTKMHPLAPGAHASHGAHDHSTHDHGNHDHGAPSEPLSDATLRPPRRGANPKVAPPKRSARSPRNDR